MEETISYRQEGGVVMNIMVPTNIEETKRQSKGTSVDISQVIRNVTGVERDQEKKSLLSRILEPEEVDDGQNDAKKAAEIAKKIARGAHVSPQEKQFLMQVDPILAQMAETARKEGERIKHALSQASTKEEQQSVVQQAYQMVQQVSKTNQQFGMLLGEAVKSAVQESRKEGHLKEAMTEVETKGEKPLSKVAFVTQEESMDKDGQQMLLEQFFPDEWMSMLDCKG